MKSPTLLFLSFLFLISCTTQKAVTTIPDAPKPSEPIAKADTNTKYNFNFETNSPDSYLSKGWFKWGTYDLSIDTLIYHTGKQAALITSDEAGSAFGSIAYSIPANYEGATIQLKGSMKLEGVENGFAGLLLRIDGEGAPLAFDNMEKQDINGTKDWMEYSITLPYPKGAKMIFVAGILAGKGKAWFDDFAVTIDGKNLQTLEEKPKPIYPANLDTTYDNGSRVTFPELNKERLVNLELLGRIWGFLKYHHPTIAKGEYNMDYELFRILPDFLKSENVANRDKLLLAWIAKYGTIPICKSCQPTAKDAFHKPDLSWIETSNMSTALQGQLRSIYQNRNQDEHFYIRMASGIGNPEFTNEKPYSNMPYPDEGFRLLTLYKYWNMIHYFFPYKHLMDKDWNQNLGSYLPKFLNAKNKLDYELAAIQLIGDVQDTHANLWGGNDEINQARGLLYPPIHVRFIENQLVVTDYYKWEFKKDIGIEVGDIITHINGKSIAQIVDSVSIYYPASNVPTRLRDISGDILRSSTNQLAIQYTSNGLKKEKLLPLYPKDKLNIYRWYDKDFKESYKMLDDNIGYITLASIKDSDIAAIKKAFINTKGIIIDIRNYPATFVPFSLGSYFVSAPTPFVKFTQGSTENPGEFTWTDPLVLPNETTSYQGQLVVLLNEFSQSQSEYTAMAFKAGANTTIIGSTTAGADGNVSKIFLPGGLRTMISGIGIYYPDGTETQRVGIVPDIEVQPTIEGIKSGRDEVLEKAIAFLKKN